PPWSPASAPPPSACALRNGRGGCRARSGGRPRDRWIRVTWPSYSAPRVAAVTRRRPAWPRCAAGGMKRRTGAAPGAARRARFDHHAAREGSVRARLALAPSPLPVRPALAAAALPAAAARGRDAGGEPRAGPRLRRGRAPAGLACAAGRARHGFGHPAAWLGGQRGFLLRGGAGRAAVRRRRGGGAAEPARPWRHAPPERGHLPFLPPGGGGGCGGRAGAPSGRAAVAGGFLAGWQLHAARRRLGASARVAARQGGGHLASTASGERHAGDGAGLARLPRLLRAQVEPLAAQEARAVAAPGHRRGVLRPAEPEED